MLSALPLWTWSVEGIVPRNVAAIEQAETFRDETRDLVVLLLDRAAGKDFGDSF
jgi:hypothetical protein